MVRPILEPGEGNNLKPKVNALNAQSYQPYMDWTRDEILHLHENEGPGQVGRSRLQLPGLPTSTEAVVCPNKVNDPGCDCPVKFTNCKATYSSYRPRPISSSKNRFALSFVPLKGPCYSRPTSSETLMCPRLLMFHGLFHELRDDA